MERTYGLGELKEPFDSAALLVTFVEFRLGDWGGGLMGRRKVK